MKINNKFVLRQIAQSRIIFSLEQSQEDSCVMSLNEAGALLWQRLEKGCSLEELAGVLVEEYALPVEQAQADAAEFVEKLRAAHCIEEL